jgi:hypothetical protein
MRSILVLAIICISSAAGADELRIPLSELIGEYQLSTFDFFTITFPPSYRLAPVETGIPISEILGFRLELVGSIFGGSVVGDGVIREPVAAPLRGSFAPLISFQSWGISQFVGEEPDGPFEKILDFPGELPKPEGYDPKNFAPYIQLSLLPKSDSFFDIDYIDVPSGPITLPALQGMNITNPMHGEITLAFLVVQFVPEPPGWVLLSFVGAFVMGGRARSSPFGRRMR